MFSIPINPKLNKAQYDHFIQFCIDHRDVIYDLYFTCRMPPFFQDAMGDIINDPYAPIESALNIQEITGIPISATFNNLDVRPTQQNLDLFITNFRQLYNSGVKSVTIPHTHWVATGQLQKEFPDLLIKNTILRQVETAKDVAALGKEGFNYVNIHRDLMRDHDTLKRIRKAADKYGMKIALLANEGCHGGCSMMKEHFQFNTSRIDGPQYFMDPISRVSCSKWNVEDSSSPLKEANIPPWREDWNELLQYVDVFKMHGRENIQRFYESLNIVKAYKNGDELLFPGFDAYLEETNLSEKPINAWRNIIKSCKFDCWDCNFCDKVYKSRSSIEAPKSAKMVVQELVDHVNSDYTNSVEGLTSPRVKKLINSFAKHAKNYLEVGSAMGATAVAALDSGANVTCVDNWSQHVYPEGGAFDLPDNTKDEFLSNTKKYTNLTIHDTDLFESDLGDTKFDMFFYDGPHEEPDTIRAIQHYSKWFDDQVVIILDDANWKGVVTGALQGLQRSNYMVQYERMVLNKVEDSSMWWNGLYIIVARKYVPIASSAS